MWLTLLRQAVDESSLSAVAKELDISRSALSLVLSGKYPASTDRIALRVMTAYGRVSCPHLGAELVERECRAYRERSCPTSSPRELRHWRACQSCVIGIGLDALDRLHQKQSALSNENLSGAATPPRALTGDASAAVPQQPRRIVA